MYITLTTIASSTIGFVAGLYAHRTPRRWCASCGGDRRCPACAVVGLRRNSSARRY